MNPSFQQRLLLEEEDEISTGGKVGLVTAGTSRVYFEGLQVKSEIFERAPAVARP